MKTLLAAFKYIGISIYLICGFMLVVLLLPWTGWKALVVATPSMTPAIGVGELVLVRSIPPSQLQIGDVVTYINPNNPKQKITHRIISKDIKYDGRIPVFVTKGDANKIPDAEIVGGNVVGKVVLHNLWLGRLVRAMQSPWGLIALVGLPAAVIIWDESRRLRRALRRSETPVGEPPAEPPPPSGPPSTQVQRAQSRPARGMDSIGPKLMVLLGAAAYAVSPTLAALQTNQATLTHNTIVSTVKVNTVNHVVINQVSIMPLNCLDFGLGPPTFMLGHICRWRTVSANPLIEDTLGTPLQADNLEVQNTTGAATNHFTSRTIVIINNHRLQLVRLYNPTDREISLKHWTLTDNSGRLYHIPSSTKIAAHGFINIFHHHIGNGLDPSGDRLILRDGVGLDVDAISWGSDHAILNPSIGAIPLHGRIVRQNPGIDTDTAADWLVVGP
jgi:signal peptidase I